MKIIIVGCGKVGTALTAQLSREDNLVTVIDTDSIVVRNVSNTYDVMGIVGNGASYQVLQEADIEHADLMIAVTKSDEMNRKTGGRLSHHRKSPKPDVSGRKRIYPQKAGSVHDHQPGARGRHGNGKTAAVSVCDRDRQFFPRKNRNAAL